ncbi:hypothetical protein ACFWMR_01810 [Amycolatopsis thailandensis]|uniref:hypothetical protein n=1 Tax=Amycolatopsis thailandensis TaxID=589330 RepID=UPI0036635C94
MTDFDPQRAAFVGASSEDWAAQAALLEGAVVHDPSDPDAAPIRTREEWDAEGWDAERQPPKTVAEAQAALAGRIADPNAPDTAVVAGAYDELEEG